jgi:IclR family acetate operon transcriptional repressor
MTETLPVKSAKVSLDIIELLRRLNGAGVSEVSNHLDMPTSTVHDHLQTLEHEEYLVKNGDTYNVSSRFLQLGEQARARKNVFTIAKPEIDELGERTGEHANLMIEEHGRGIFLYISQGADAVQVDTHAGKRVYLQTTALGKAIMAYRPREEIESILDRHGLPQITENTITDREQLFKELKQVRERGYAYDDEERVKGMRCVAAPITDESDRAIASVSVSGPRSRMRQSTYTEEIPELLLRTANVIEVNLSHS